MSPAIAPCGDGVLRAGIFALVGGGRYSCEFRAWHSKHTAMALSHSALTSLVAWDDVIGFDLHAAESMANATPTMTRR
jgi:hypothetical protein